MIGTPMLPDYPATKRCVAEALEEWLRTRFRAHLGPLGGIGTHRAFEGHQFTTARPGGEKTDNPRELLESMTIRFDEVPTLTLADIQRRIDDVAEKLARAQAKDIYAHIDAAVAEIGNAVNCNGEPLGATHLLELVAKVEVDFDDRGHPRLPSIFVHPDKQEAVKRVLEELSSNPDLASRWEALIIRKREEWRDREASRSLAG
jgi:hypothetical protein